MNLHQLKLAWEDLGTLDPYWAVLTDPDARFKKWDKQKFFRTGEDEIDKVIKDIKKLPMKLTYGTALDFGCGVGRLTAALANYFTKAYGIDISEPMIMQAKKALKSKRNCRFMVNEKPDLSLFKDNSFDFIYSNIVLQHVPKNLTYSYLKEFVRTVKPGGLIVFQLPSYIPLRQRFQLHNRLYSILRRLGFKESYLYNRLQLYPIRMNYIEEKKVTNYLKSIHCKVIKVKKDNSAGEIIQSRLYYVTKK